MARTGVVIDSTADLSEQAAARTGSAQVVPLVVNWDDQSYRDKLDLTTEQFYARLRTSKTTPKTGAPSLGVFDEVHRRGLEQHEGLVFIGISGKLSATVRVTQTAAVAVHPTR